MFLIFIVSILGTLLWSTADRKRKSYSTLYYWLSVAVRYYVGLMLFNYGIVKIFKLQFADLSLHRLTETYGASSPMGLAWAFFGFSKAYNIFIGIAEMCAVFLLFRRTLTFGAIITLMTTINVMLVNYCYDIPVKIITTALVVMTIFLLARDFKRICIFLFTGNAIALPKIESPPIRKKWLRIFKITFKFLLLAYIGFMTIRMVSAYEQFSKSKPKLYGVWSVIKYELKNDSTGIQAQSDSRWTQLVLDDRYRVMLRLSNGLIQETSFEESDFQKQLTIYKPHDHAGTRYFHFQINGNKLFLRGKFENDSILVELKKDSMNSDMFRLKNSEFHWIQEAPNNK